MAKYAVVIREGQDAQAIADKMNFLLFDDATVSDARPEGIDDDDSGTVVHVTAPEYLYPGQEKFLERQPAVHYYYHAACPDCDSNPCICYS